MTISCAPWQYMTISYYLIISHYFIYLIYLLILCFSMFCMIFLTASISQIWLHDVTEGGLLDFADPTCTLDLSHFKGLGLSTIQRLCMPSTSQCSISPDLLKESLVSEEWKWWIENKEKFRADLVGGSAEGQKSNYVCRGQAFTTLSCWSEVFDHFRVNGDTWLLMIKHGRSSRCHALPKRDSGAPLLLKAHESKDFDLWYFFLRLQFIVSVFGHACYPWNVDSDRLQQQHALIRVNRPAAVGAATKWEWNAQQQTGSRISFP